MIFKTGGGWGLTYILLTRLVNYERACLVHMVGISLMVRG